MSQAGHKHATNIHAKSINCESYCDLDQCSSGSKWIGYLRIMATYISTFIVHLLRQPAPQISQALTKTRKKHQTKHQKCLNNERREKNKDGKRKCPTSKDSPYHLRTIQGTYSFGHGLRLHRLQLGGVAAGLRDGFRPQGTVHGTAPGTVPRDGRKLHVEGQRVHLPGE